MKYFNTDLRLQNEGSKQQIHSDERPDRLSPGMITRAARPFANRAGWGQHCKLIAGQVLKRHYLSMMGSGLLLLVLSAGSPSWAQKRIPKAPGHDQCPLGYINTLGSDCVSPIYYEVAPTYGQPCLSGWMNIGAGYCKKKTLWIF